MLLIVLTALWTLYRKSVKVTGQFQSERWPRDSLYFMNFIYIQLMKRVV